MAKKKIKIGEAVPIRLVWDKADDLETIYVNHAAIIHNGPEYYLLFGELTAPLILSEKEIPDAVHIVPKVRLAISPSQIKAIADVINKIANADSENKNDDA